MNNLFTYLLELNISIVILFVAYKILFEKDKNFVIRRIYLLAVIVLPFILLLIPDAARMPVNRIAPISINLEGITVFGSDIAQEATNTVSIGKILLLVYLLILAFGIIKLMIQLVNIIRAAYISERMEISGTIFLSNSKFHASSFFGYIFIDATSVNEDSFNHIVEHENIHKREWHSIDRILVELFVMINWFNPLAWMFRKSVIENLEYLADSAVLKRGTDSTKYQMSILNQYLGSTSISNQFSSQIKNRIVMLNKDYKLGSKWKLFLLIPLTYTTFFIGSCTEKDVSSMAEEAIQPITEEVDLKGEIPNATTQPDLTNEEVFYIVEEMPTFKGGEPGIEFRNYIAQNLRYPEIAMQDSISGPAIVQFAVNSEGKVVDAVVVRSVSPAIDKEAIRVVMSSPEWIPGKQHGKAVKVLFTFPINFVLK